MRKIRILHVAQAAGGVDRYIRMLLKYMDKEKYKNILVCSQDFHKEEWPQTAAKETDDIVTRQLCLKNTGNCVAAGVWIHERETDITVGSLLCSDNYLCLKPKENTNIWIKATIGTRLVIEGWNLAKAEFCLE